MIVIAPFELRRCDAPLVLAVFDNLLSLQSLAKRLRASLDVVLVAPNINRFFKRTIYEVASLLQSGQRLHIVLETNQHLSDFGVKAILEELFPGAYKFSPDVSSIKGVVDLTGFSHVLSFCLAGETPSYVSAPFSGWSVGILTKNPAAGYLDQFIQSVMDAADHANLQNIEVQILSSDDGAYDFSVHPNVTHYSRPELANDSNISYKKNFLASHSKWSELLLCHDRFFLSHDFFSRAALQGTRYGLVAPRVRLLDGRRSLDWAVVTSRNYTWSKGAQMNYRDFNDFVYVPGGATVIRRAAWERCRWNENILWNEHEDVEMARRFQRQGGVIGLSDGLLLTTKDRWLDHNILLPLDDDKIVLPGDPVGETRIVRV